MVYKRKGAEGYDWKFMVKGKVERGSCHTNDKRTARQVEAAKRVEFAKDRAGIGSKKKTPTFADYATNVFLPGVRINKADKHFTVTYYVNSIAHLLKSPLASKRLDDIETADVTAHKGRMQKDAFSISTINGSLRALKRLLNVACEADIIPKVIKIVMLSGANTRDFVLREQDEAEYLAACERLQNHVAIHMLDMAFRPEEIHQLSWQQIHGDSITIYKGKGDGSRRTVDMTQRVMEVLTERGLLDENLREHPYWVFPAPTKTGHIDHSSTKGQHENALKIVRERKAGRVGKDVEEIDFDFVPYSLRHTSITLMAEDGLSAPDLMYFAGHKHISTTMKYIHLASRGVNYRVNEARLKRRKVVTDLDPGKDNGQSIARGCSPSI